MNPPFLERQNFMFSRYCVLFLTLSFIACAPPNDSSKRNPALNEFGTCNHGFIDSKTCMDLIWEKKPTDNDFGSFVLEFYNVDDHSVFVETNGNPFVTLWLPEVSRAASPVQVDRLATGQYRVSNVYFGTHGDWEIQVKILGPGTTNTLSLPYRF